MALKKGICKNFDNCTLADNNEIQEVDSSEFRCAECGKELCEYKEPKKTFPLKLILIIVAVLLLIGGGIWAYFGLIRGRSVKPDESVSLSLNRDKMTLYVGDCDTLIATVTAEPTDAAVSTSFTSDDENIVKIDPNGIVHAIAKGEANIIVIARIESGIADTAQVMVSVNEVQKPEPSINDDPPSEQQIDNKAPAGGNNNRGTYNPGWYTYNGPMRNGKPADGIFGEMKITRDTIIDLKDGLGGTLEVRRGDVIANPKFKDGKFIPHGELHRKDGTRKVF